MKKILCYIICLIIMICSSVNVKANEFTVGLNSTLNQNEVKVDVYLENNPGLVSLLFNIIYDSDVLTLIEVKDCGKFGNSLHSNRYESPYSLCWANDTIRDNIHYNGVIATITFTINDHALIKESDIHISYKKDDYAFIDVNLNQYNPSIKDTKIIFQNNQDNYQDNNDNKLENENVNQVIKVEKKDPTCKEMGNIEYYYDEQAHKYYLDDVKTQEITLEDTQLHTIDHQLILDEKGNQICKNCGDILEKENNNSMTVYIVCGVTISIILIAFMKKNQNSKKD